MPVKINSPLDLLIIILDRGQSKKAIKILNKDKCVFHFVTYGKGTADSNIAEIFGLGIADRDIVFALCKSDLSKQTLKNLCDKFKLDEPKNGIAFSVSLTSAGNDLLDLLKIKY